MTFAESYFVAFSYWCHGEKYLITMSAEVYGLTWEEEFSTLQFFVCLFLNKHLDRQTFAAKLFCSQLCIPPLLPPLFLEQEGGLMFVHSKLESEDATSVKLP